MRNLRVFTGQAMVTAASLLLMTACGGGGSDIADALTSTTESTTSTTAETTTSTEATTTTSTEATTTTSTEATTTSTASTTTTTVADPFNLAAATLVVQHSGLCMSVPDTVSGSNARQTACVAGNPAQGWEIKPTGTGTDYTIRSLQSNLCLRVNDTALNADPLVLSLAVQGPCDGSTNTLWNFRQSPTPGQFNVVAKHSSLCLDVPGSEQAPGTAIIQYTCNTAVNQPNQRWVITAIAP